MTTTSLSLAGALSAYGASTHSKSTDTSTQAASTAKSTALTQSSAGSSSLSSTSGQTSARAAAARQHLNMLQKSLAKDINAALAKAGQKLGGTVEFSVGSDGKLTISGDEKDKAKISAVLKADKSVPSITSRLADLDKQAEAFDKQNVQASALSTAARRAGKNAQNLLALYQSLMASQTSASAVFSMSASTSQLAFKGSVSTSA